jgi:integrase
MSWMLRAKFPGGTVAVRRRIGDVGKMDLDRARGIAKEWWELIRVGKNPADVLKSQKAKAATERENTVKAVAADWIRLVVRNPVKPYRQAREYERQVNREIVPGLGDRSVADLTAKDIIGMVEAIRDRGAFYVAHYCYATTRSMLAWAVSRQSYGLTYSPCEFPTRIQISRILGRRQKRRRSLNPAELRAYMLAAREQATPWAQYFQLTMYTGQRRDDVAKCVWSEFNFEAEPATWFIGAARYKTEVDVLHPLSRQAVALLESLPVYKSGPHCLTTTWGTKAIAGFSHAKRRLMGRMLEILRKDDPKAELPAFWLHDARRNLKAGMSSIGIPDDHSEACLGHVPEGIRGHYQVHDFFEQKAVAFQRWADHVDAIVEGKVGKVLPMRRKAG